MFPKLLRKTGVFFTHNLLRSIDADLKALFHYFSNFFYNIFPFQFSNSLIIHEENTKEINV